jgi:hypothetical protein
MSTGHQVQLHGQGNPNVLTNDGTLNFTGTNVAMTLVNNGTTNVLAATGLSTNFNTPITQAAGSLNVPGSLNAPSLSMTGGSTTVDGTLNVTNNLPLTGGTLQGAGTVIDPSGVTNSGGTVHPGHSPGILSITGDYTQASGGTLALDVAGASPGTGYSRLAVSGNASLAGTLDVTTQAPQTGAPRVLTASAVSGTFSPVNFTGQTDAVVYDATGVQLNATAPPPPAPPVATAPPVVSGSPTVGSTLSSTQGSFSGNQTSFAYRWFDCNVAGAACSNIAGATSTTYHVAGSDVGHTLVVVVTATNAGGSGFASSKPTAVVPAVSVAPAVSHAHLGSSKFTAKAGTTLALDLSEPATLTVTIYHRVSGRVVHGRCRTGAKHGHQCSLTAIVRKLTLNAIAGHNVLHPRFAGLKPGRYTMTVVARDTAGRRSNTITLNFVVKKPKK